MEHSKNYQKVKRYYDLKMWDETRVCNAVKWVGLRKRSIGRSQAGIIDECSDKRPHGI